MIISLLGGVGMLWVFKRTSNPARISKVKRLVQAHLLEMRLFRDEPGVVWQAQKSLLTSNAKYMGLMLQPAIWIAIPLTLLFFHMEAFHGREPLPLNRDAIVTMGMRAPIDASAAVPVMTAPAGIVAVTPPVRVLGDRQISWRIRPVAPVSGSLRFAVGGETIEKKIETGPGARFVPGLRPSSLLDAIWHPDEPRIQSAAVDWIDVRYPDANVAIFGIQLHWLIWFTIISMIFALLFRKRFGVVL
ncbi:MAG: hypothetical protein ABJF23_14985 [Bryobacteraceae bacterium]